MSFIPTSEKHLLHLSKNATKRSGQKQEQSNYYIFSPQCFPWYFSHSCHCSFYLSIYFSLATTTQAECQCFSSVWVLPMFFWSLTKVLPLSFGVGLGSEIQLAWYITINRSTPEKTCHQKLILTFLRSPITFTLPHRPSQVQPELVYCCKVLGRQNILGVQFIPNINLNTYLIGIDQIDRWMIR